MPVYLTEQIDFYYVPYPKGAAGTTNITGDDIDYKIVATIDSGHGVMACGISYGNISNHASILPGYPALKIGHWIAIDGYKDSGAKYLVKKRSRIMKKKILLVCIVFVSTLLFSSCSSETIKTDDNNLSITQKGILTHSPLIYDLKKEILPAEEFIKIQKLIFPKEIDGKKLSVLGFFDKKDTLLYEENPFPILKEIGTYNFELNNYDKLFETRENINKIL